MHNSKGFKPMGSQSGAVLVVSLIILLLITIVGASTIRTATLEERMAAGVRNKDIALQAAEAALVAAEDNILNNVTTVASFTADCTNGLCAAPLPNATDHRWDMADMWDPTGNKSVELTGDIYTDVGEKSGYAKAPRYFVEVLTSYQIAGDNINLSNYGDDIRNTEVTVLRVTALGYGGSEDAQVMLQTTVAKLF